MFNADNNGALLQLPSIPATGQSTVSGSLIFGIGTQSNNALGSAVIYALNSSGDLQTTYPVASGAIYPSFLDSSSNAINFLDATTLAPAGVTACLDNPTYYCPSATLQFTVTNTGTNGASGPVTFSIVNADALFAIGNVAFNDLGGVSGTSPATDYFDFGLPFFFGRNVFVGVAGTTVPTGTSAPYGYVAY